MSIPDVVGLTLGEAMKWLNDAGLNVINILLTSPPRLNLKEYDPDCRVLRVKELTGRKVELLVCKPTSSISSTPL